MPGTTLTPNRPVANCVELASLFQNPLLEDPIPANAPAAVRRRYTTLVNQAEDVCSSCPLIEGCLYQAVVEQDVAGYVAGTTPAQRAAIRARLNATVEPEDFDTLAGVVGGRHRQVDHDEVVRLRHAHPDESLETMARRLGCSLSTVKRHLRKERREPSRRASVARPTLATVVRAAAEIVRWPAGRDRAA
jgi:hypothetical protein